jgi:hypothetical protein
LVKQDKKKEPTVEEPKVLLAIDGVNYDWSYMADEEEASLESALVATKLALMAFSDSEVHSNESCSKSCKSLKECNRLRDLLDKQTTELMDSNYTLSNYKRGLSVLETQIEHYRANESKFNDDIAVLKRDLDYKVAVNEALREELEKLKKANENIQITCNTLDHQSKCIDKIWEAQVVNKAKSGVGYKSVPPPLRGVPAPPGIDLAHTWIEEFHEPIMTYGLKFVKEAIDEKVKVKTDAFESASDSSLVDESVKVEVKTCVPEVVKVEQEEPRKQAYLTRPTIKYAEMYRNRSPAPRGNQRNWNNLKSQQFGSDFVFNNKACHI